MKEPPQPLWQGFAIVADGPDGPALVANRFFKTPFLFNSPESAEKLRLKQCGHDAMRVVDVAILERT